MLSRERERFGKKKKNVVARSRQANPAASITEPEGREEIKKRSYGCRRPVRVVSSWWFVPILRSRFSCAFLHQAYTERCLVVFVGERRPIKGKFSAMRLM